MPDIPTLIWRTSGGVSFNQDFKNALIYRVQQKKVDMFDMPLWIDCCLEKYYSTTESTRKVYILELTKHLDIIGLHMVLRC